jgi:hypothetical protein
MNAASPGFDDKVVALYARGLTVREIQAFLADMYAVDVSPELISTALRVKIRDEATGRSKAIYLALAVLPDGTRQALGKPSHPPFLLLLALLPFSRDPLHQRAHISLMHQQEVGRTDGFDEYFSRSRAVADPLVPYGLTFQD